MLKMERGDSFYGSNGTISLLHMAAMRFGGLF